MLIVDDSLSMRHVLSVAVKKAGWMPVPARDGLEALDLIQRAAAPPDLVLLDIEMPRMDGFEFLSTVRSQKGRADLPIVMLTSRSGDKHRDKATALGVTDYMVKPFQEDALIRNIDRLVQGVAPRGTAGRVMIRVAIADDSPFTCNLLASYIEAGGDCRWSASRTTRAPRWI